jgi:limonene-1,2-epoxide hydrolase
MTQDPGALVRAFLGGMGTSTEGDVAQFEAYLAEDVVWHTGTRLREGRAAAVAHIRAAPDNYGVATWTADILHQAENGDAVLNERIDRVFRPDGSHLADLRVAATFEIRAGRIAAWRDYYDPSTLVAAVAARQNATA